MSAEEVIELEAFPLDWESTLEGRKRAQEISDRNIEKLRLWTGPGEPPSDYVRLQQDYRDNF